MLLVGLGRFVQDLLLWSTAEFDYVRLGDGFVQCSSIMPQKRNPVAFEHARAIGSKALGQSQAIVISVHNTPFGDIVDTEDDLQPLVFSMFRDATRMVKLVAAAIKTAEFDAARLKTSAGDGWTTLTELADTLVRDHGLPFKTAHAIAARLVAAGRRNPDQPLSALLAEATKGVLETSLPYTDRDLETILSPRHFVNVRKTYGGPAQRRNHTRDGGLGDSFQHRPGLVDRQDDRPDRRRTASCRSRPGVVISPPQGDHERDTPMTGTYVAVVILRSRHHRAPLCARQDLLVSWIDWAIVVAYLLWIVIDGIRRSKNTNKVEGYFLANRSLPWWAVGLSVMATQISAITLVGTTGQAYATGLRFVQFYFGLPIAMVILSLTVVPFFTRARVYTAYEYLERRFDVRIRTAASFLFLVGRAFSLGVTLAAPAVVISAILGWSIPITVLLLSVPMVIYTSFGGVQAVAWTDVKQMAIIVFGLFAAIGILIFGITRDVGFGQAVRLAGATGRMQAIDTRVDLTQTYTLWSGLLGGLFLSLSYFGCDQSQVQRYLTAKSIDEARHSLLMSAFVKIPFQLLILGAGVLTFLFYVFQTPPMLFNRAYDAQIAGGPHAAEYAALQHEFDAGVAARRQAAVVENREQFLAADRQLQDIRARAVAVVKQATGDERYNDVNYVFPTFITTRLPVGLVGLMIAAIFGAAMSARQASSARCRRRRSSTSIDGFSSRMPTTRTICASRRSRRWVGGCLRAWSRSTRRTRDR